MSRPAHDNGGVGWRSGDGSGSTGLSLQSFAQGIDPARAQGMDIGKATVSWRFGHSHWCGCSLGLYGLELRSPRPRIGRRFSGGLLAS